MQRLHHLEIIGWLKIKQLKIIVFILIPANSCMRVFYSFIIYFYLCPFFCLFRITSTRNSQLNVLKLLARAVVHLGEWYPYLGASTMWDPQRKKDFFLIETKPLFAPHKILFVLQKKGQHRKPFLSPTKFLNCYQTSKILSRIFGGLQFFVGWQNPLFLDRYPLLGHLISRTWPTVRKVSHAQMQTRSQKQKLVIILQSSLSVWTPLYYGQFPNPDKILIIFPKNCLYNTDSL